jgi:hypothetical protein
MTLLLDTRARVSVGGGVRPIAPNTRTAIASATAPSIGKFDRRGFTNRH